MLESGDRENYILAYYWLSWLFFGPLRLTTLWVIVVSRPLVCPATALAKAASPPPSSSRLTQGHPSTSKRHAFIARFAILHPSISLFTTFFFTIFIFIFLLPLQFLSTSPNNRWGKYFAYSLAIRAVITAHLPTYSSWCQFLPIPSCQWDLQLAQLSGPNRLRKPSNSNL